MFAKGIFLDISKALDKASHDGFLFQLNIWCWRWPSFTTQKLPRKLPAKNCSRWSNNWVEKTQLRSSTRIDTRASFVSNIHNWSTWWYNFNMCNVCWRIFPFIKSTKYIVISKLNCDLEKVINWIYQWKMQFNPDPNKQENEVISSRKWNSDSFPYPSAKLIENNTSKCSHQKHPGIATHSKLVFNTHIDQKIQTTRLMKRLLVNLPRSALLAIWKSFIRSRLSYDHILCE